jgi:hypothetical protein
MVFKLWTNTLKKDEVVEIYNHAGESGVKIGIGHLFFDTSANKLKVYIS